jgi:hypothetical protein
MLLTLMLMLLIAAGRAHGVHPSQDITVAFDLPGVLQRSDLLWIWSGKQGYVENRRIGTYLACVWTSGRL